MRRRGIALADVARSTVAAVTVVLVHGQPETDAVWGPLVEELTRRGGASDDYRDR